VNRFLFKQIDNAGLVLFRIVFGLLISINAFGSIATGWVRETLTEPQFTFTFIGFDFLQLIPPGWIYVFFITMGICGIFVMIGFKYRLSMFLYALLWTTVYLMQKISYNNHYYLMMLLCWIMTVLPAANWFSADAKLNPRIRSVSMPRWVLLVLILQVWIVYTYATVAKIYPGWLDGTAAGIFMKSKKNYWLIGELLQKKWTHLVMAYTGIFFDLLIVPLLLWKRTRMTGFVLSVFFHLFNSIVFQIGIFPYMSMAFAFFFFTPQTLIKRFLPKKPLYQGDEVSVPSFRNVLLLCFGVYFAFQIGLPLRHWFFEDDVLWTEEGHRLSWRMMLRSRSGILTVYVSDTDSSEKEFYNYYQLLTPKQAASVQSRPDMMWQLAQKIKKTEAEKGRDVAVFMDAQISINGGPYFPFTDPETDLASEPWNHFKHSPWILPSPEKYTGK